MRIKFSLALSILMLLLFASLSLAASPTIKMTGEAHVGERVVLAVETSQIPTNGSVEWSVSPTTGKTPDRISLRAGGRECTFTPLDTQPIRVVASLINRDGEVVSSNELLVNPKEFQIDIAVVIDKPLTLWDASKRANYVLSPDILLANSPIKLRASLNPSFRGEHTFKWVGDAATALSSQDKDDIFIRRGTIGESEISVTAFNSSGIKLGSGESRVSITLPVSTFEDSSNERDAWQNWQRSQALWESKNYAEAVELAQRAVSLSPRDTEILEGLRAMNTNYARFLKANKLREDAIKLDKDKKFDDALKNLRIAQIIWPLENGVGDIEEAEKKVNEQRLLQQQANWLRDTASAYDNENMYEDALEYYAKSLELVPSDAVADRMERIRNRLTLIADADRYAGEGTTLEREGKLQDALNHYSASIMSNPDASLRQHIEELQSVISRRERQANALYREGQDLQRRNQNQEALKRYTESMNVWPNDNAKQRINQLSRSIRLTPDTVIRGPEDFGIGTKIDAQRIIQTADELYSQGKIDEAVTLYRKALSISPSNEMKNWVAKLDKVIRERDSVEAANKLITEANALYKAGKTKEAIDLYRQSLSIHKNAEIETFIRNQGAK